MTTTEAAKELGIARRTVQMWCTRLDIGKAGRDYWLNPNDLDRIKENLGNVGYPKGRPRSKKRESPKERGDA